MLTIVFPGQGAQKKGMGKDLFASFPNILREADSILGYSLGDLCLEDPEDKLVQTQYTQPALFVVGALAWLARLEQGALPQLLAGHSLGEYNALFASGAFDFATGLKLVAKRGELMSRASGGGMAAVLGLPADKIAAVLEAEGATEVDVANDNSPSQVVISGRKDQVEGVLKAMELAGASRCKMLPVSAAFHSRQMVASADAFRTYLADIRFEMPRIPVMSNVTARPYENAEQISELLARQIVMPVRWTESMRYAMAKGADSIEELGVGRVLTSLFRQIKREAKPLSPGELAAETPVGGQPEQAAKGPAPAGLLGPISLDIRAETLGSASFKQAYGLRYAYVAGAMYKGIASKELVVRMGKAGLLSFLGTGGLSTNMIEKALDYIQPELA